MHAKKSGGLGRDQDQDQDQGQRAKVWSLGIGREKEISSAAQRLVGESGPPQTC